MGSYKEIDKAEYLAAFGIKKKKSSKNYRVKDRDKLLYAYKRACENRDFEINKFWTRAAYFWGFIVLTFTAYFSLITSENPEKADELALLVISVGIVLSVAWTFVIKGSKKWQENWELHIDFLEDFVSGPSYKTIFKTGTFYSVSKINEIISYLMITVWTIIYLYHIISYGYVISISNGILSVAILVLVSLLLILIFTITIIFGYGKSKIKANGWINLRIH